MAYIHGQFKNINNTTYNVDIVSNNDRTQEYVIGESGLYFAGDPVTIETNIEDTFQHVIMKSATIDLVTDNYIGYTLFANNATDISVIITNEDTDECVFYGFVEPSSFTQPFNLDYDRFTLNCIDALATLQYYNYNDTTLSNYETKKTDISNKSFYTLLNEMFAKIKLTNSGIYYDSSKGITEARTQYVFNDLGISELNMYGETFDDVWTYQSLLEEMLRYLNLHIIQIGIDFYIFDWQTLKKSGSKRFINILNNTSKTINVQNITLTGEMHTSSNTNISVISPYSQIQINCDINGLEDIIQNPLDSDNLTSLYEAPQKYADEIISWHTDSFLSMIKGETGYNVSDTWIYKWYMQIMDNPNWKMYIGNKTPLSSIYEQDANGTYINQQNVTRYMLQNQLTPAIVRFSKVKIEQDPYDNSLVNNKDTNDYLYISVNGNEKDTASTSSPTSTTLQNHSGMIEYVSTVGGVVFSPVDDSTTNYLVFSGKMLLQPIVYESEVQKEADGDSTSRTNNYQALKEYTGNRHYIASVDSDNDQHGWRYYTRKFYKTKYPKIDENIGYYTDTIGNLQPWTDDKGHQTYEYKYTYVGESLESIDQFSKLPILECELIIGDKRCVEINMDEYGHSEFVWVDADSGVEETYVDENGKTQTYLKKTFSLGIDPKRNDFIIGTDFDLQNTIDYAMNLDDASGTAIPIKKDDHLSGKVTFRILGPINLVWNDITRRHPSFWRHTSVTSESKFILAHTQNIIIKDFKCKIYSDNGMKYVTGDNDLIYMSNENLNYINKRDDIDFKFVTQLTVEERIAKGINTAIIYNNVINQVDGLPLTSIYNGSANTNDIDKTAKAEEHYIAEYFRAYDKPKVLLETDLDSRNINFFNIITSTPLNKTFFVQSIGNNLMYDSAHVQLKEI